MQERKSPISSSALIIKTASAKKSIQDLSRELQSKIFQYLDRESVMTYTTIDKELFNYYFQNKDITLWQNLTAATHPREFDAVVKLFPSLESIPPETPQHEIDELFNCSTFYRSPATFWRMAYFAFSLGVGNSKYNDYKYPEENQLFFLFIVCNELFGMMQAHYAVKKLDVMCGKYSMQHWARSLDRQDILDVLYDAQIEAIKCHQPVDAILSYHSVTVLSQVLSSAVQYSHIELVQHLIREAKPNVNETGDDDNLLLRVAASNGNLKIVRCLVEEGHADPLLVDSKGSPLEAAAKNGHFPVLKYFIEVAKADLSKPDKSFYMQYGQDVEHPAIIRSFKKNPESCGYALLHVAVKRYQFAIVKYLVEQCKVAVNPNNKNYSAPVIFSAMEIKNKENALTMLKYLVTNGADINQINRNFYTGAGTVLYCAAAVLDLSMVKFLVEVCHADPNVVNEDLKTPLHAAQFSKCSEWNEDALNQREKIINYLTPLTFKCTHKKKPPAGICVDLESEEEADKFKDFSTLMAETGLISDIDVGESKEASRKTVAQALGLEQKESDEEDSVSLSPSSGFRCGS